MRKALVAVLLGSLVLVATAPAQTAKEPDYDAILKQYAERAEKARLRGLDGVNLRFVGIRGPESSDLLSSEELKRIVELRFRANGVKVYDSMELIKNATNDADMTAKLAELNKLKLAQLDVDFTVLKTKDGVYVYSFEMSLGEPAVLKRDPKITVEASLWGRNKVGFAGSAVAKDAMRQTVEATIEEVCLALLKAKE